MALIPIHFEGQFWGNQTTEGVKYNLGLYNNGSTSARIHQVYVKNIISNPQEYGSIISFAITIGGVDYTDLGSPNFVYTNYNIPYPSYYGLQPGNLVYNNIPILASLENYKLIKSFDLHSGKKLGFELRFTPPSFQVDYYEADLVISFSYFGESTVNSITKRIKATLTANIDEVDGKDFVMEIAGINGVPLNNILILQ